MGQIMLQPPRAAERVFDLLASDPFRGPSSLGLPQLFDDFRGHLAPAHGDATLAPATDVVEESDAIRMSLELPGLRKEDVHIQLENGVLSISGEKKADTTKKTKSVQRLERRYGAFYRSFTLPPSVNAEAAEAELKDGVLLIRLPKREESQARAVKIR
jgi:HSP20 family protein